MTIEQQLIDTGHTHYRIINEDDEMAVMPMTYGKGRLVRGFSVYGWEEVWCYATFQAALDAMARFDPVTMKEPEGWFRSINDGRRRPDGDPSKEYIYR